MSRGPSADAESTTGAGLERVEETGTSDADSLLADLGTLTDEMDESGAEDEIREITELLVAVHERDLIDSGVRRLDAGDIAEAFVGSVIFATPLLVEDGVFDIANHLFRATVYDVPVYLVANTLFVVLMTYALLEWTGREAEEMDLLFGVFPMRVLMVLVVSFIVATALMTVWGRVGDWRPPAEALARINVIWTIGSLGAALGDILGEDDETVRADISPDTKVDTAGTPRQAGHDATVGGGESGTVSEADLDPDPDPTLSGQVSDAVLMRALTEQFDQLESLVTTPERQHEIQRLRDRTANAVFDTTFGDHVRKYTSRDIAEAVVGSVFFSIPFLVEDGVFDVAMYFLSFRIGQFPVFFLVNAGFVFLMVWGLVYWAGPQDVVVSRPLFGFVPRRLLGIAVVSFLTVATLMTMWGRVGDWADPAVAVARISVVWTVASFGAALGDILPGESSGADINDEFAELGERVEDLVD